MTMPGPELEGGVSAGDIGGGGDSLFKWAGGLIIGLITALAGYAVKRHRQENATEDSVFSMSAKTIDRLNAEVMQLQAVIDAQRKQILELHNARLESDGTAARAKVAAELAQEAAARASEMAKVASNEVDQMRKHRIRDAKIIALLREALIDAGIPIPPEPI